MPIKIDGKSGLFVPDTLVRKIAGDYALLRFYRAQYLLQNEQIREWKRINANQEAVTRSLLLDVTDLKEIAAAEKRIAQSYKDQLTAERKKSKLAKVRNTILMIVVPSGTAAIGYLAGRYLPR